MNRRFPLSEEMIIMTLYKDPIWLAGKYLLERREK
jgi:hypothetical protein